MMAFRVKGTPENRWTKIQEAARLDLSEKVSRVVNARLQSDRDEGRITSHADGISECHLKPGEFFP
jgi:hypothetical protein